MICCNFVSLKFSYFLLYKTWATSNATKNKRCEKQNKTNYSKKKKAEYYLLNKEAIKNETNRYKNMKDKEIKQKKNIKKFIIKRN